MAENTANIVTLSDSDGNIIYPRTSSSALSDLPDLVYLNHDSEESVSDIYLINADTLNGFSSAYFASKQELNSFMEDVNNSIGNISTTLDRINGVVV